MRPLLALACAAAGVLTGLGSVLAHGENRVGLALAVATSLTVLVALPTAWWGRVPFALGWVAVVGRAAWPRPEGDYLVGGDTAGYTLLGTGLVLLVVAFLTLPGARRERADRVVSPPPT